MCLSLWHAEPGVCDLLIGWRLTFPITEGAVLLPEGNRQSLERWALTALRAHRSPWLWGAFPLSLAFMTF